MNVSITFPPLLFGRSSNERGAIFSSAPHSSPFPNSAGICTCPWQDAVLPPSPPPPPRGEMRNSLLLLPFLAISTMFLLLLSSSRAGGDPPLIAAAAPSSSSSSDRGPLECNRHADFSKSEGTCSTLASFPPPLLDALGTSKTFLRVAAGKNVKKKSRRAVKHLLC